MENLKCKGARDLLPADMERFRLIEDAFRNCCTGWGFQEVRTPILEYLFLFTSAGTLSLELLNKIYSFLDWDGWSGERVVLRPDGTIPVARLYTENFLKQNSSKLFYIANVFSFEDTGIENRERWQCGVEYIGNKSVVSDVEIILLAKQALTSIGINNIKINLSHAGILKALFADLKLNPDQEEQLLNQIKKGNWKSLSRYSKENADISRILDLILNIKGKSVGFLENIKALPNISKKLAKELYNFAEIAALLDSMNCLYRIDFTSTYGFEYYTGINYQFICGEQKIGGGGRYDNLIPLIADKKTPACGFALYMDSLMDMIKPGTGSKITDKVIIICPDDKPDLIYLSLELAQTLRKNNFVTEIIPPLLKTKGRWFIKLDKKHKQFAITDTRSKSVKEDKSVNGVLAFLKETSKIDKPKK
jgi:histidyl-tRNA synthetase